MRFIIVLALAAACGGCASVTRGWDEQIQFDSVPPGAAVRTSIQTQTAVANTSSRGDNPQAPQMQAASLPGPACTTPCVIKVRRNDRFVATFTKPGYRSESIEVNTRIAGAGVAGMAGNVIIGGVVGVAVDAASGATLEHFPNPVVARLRRLAGSPGPATTSTRQPRPLQ